jgi:zinc transporter, ZIP family
MGAAFGWGLLAASSLVIGSLVAIWLNISLRVIGLIMGFGAGVLISAVAFDLVEEAASKSSGQGAAAWGLFIGCGVFFGGDLLISRLGGGDRKDPTGDQQSGSPLAIVLGTVLDGIPESMVIGLRIFAGGEVGAAYLAAVFISKLPRSDLVDDRPGQRRLEEVANPVDVDRDRCCLRARLAGLVGTRAVRVPGHFPNETAAMSACT